MGPPIHLDKGGPNLRCESTSEESFYEKCNGLDDDGGN